MSIEFLKPRTIMPKIKIFQKVPLICPLSTTLSFCVCVKGWQKFFLDVERHERDMPNAVIYTLMLTSFPFQRHTVCELATPPFPCLQSILVHICIHTLKKQDGLQKKFPRPLSLKWEKVMVSHTQSLMLLKVCGPLSIVFRPWFNSVLLYAIDRQGQLYYSGQKWAFWGWIRWGHFFKKQLWPNYRSHKVPQGIKWKLRILSFQWYPMSILGSSSLDTTALQSWAFFQKI